MRRALHPRHAPDSPDASRMVRVASRDRLLRISKLEPVPRTMARSVGRAARHQPCKTGHHREDADQHTDDPGNPDDDDRECQAQRHAPEVHAGYSGDLLQDVHATRLNGPPRRRRCRRCTRRAGGKPLTSASIRAIATPEHDHALGAMPASDSRDAVTGKTAAATASPGTAAATQATQIPPGSAPSPLHRKSRWPSATARFRYPLTHGLHHRIAGQEQQREEHGADDRVPPWRDVADLTQLRTARTPTRPG